MMRSLESKAIAENSIPRTLAMFKSLHFRRSRWSLQPDFVYIKQLFSIVFNKKNHTDSLQKHLLLTDSLRSSISEIEVVLTSWCLVVRTKKHCFNLKTMEIQIQGIVFLGTTKLLQKPSIGARYELGWVPKSQVVPTPTSWCQCCLSVTNVTYC